MSASLLELIEAYADACIAVSGKDGDNVARTLSAVKDRLGAIERAADAFGFGFGVNETVGDLLYGED